MYKIKCQAVSVSAACGIINVAQQKNESGAAFSLFDKDVLARRLSLKLGTWLAFRPYLLCNLMRNVI